MDDLPPAATTAAADLPDSRAIRERILASAATSQQSQWIRAAYDLGWHDAEEAAAALPHLTPPPPDSERERMLVRRVKAQEALLVCYRLGKRPTEKLFRELDATRAVADLLGGE